MRHVSNGFQTCLLIAFFIATSCVTPQQKRQMDDDIYRLQTKVLELESAMNHAKVSDQKVGEANNKTIASTSSDVERLGIEVKRMKGDSYALKVGVQTGQMPGQETPQEGSIATQLSDIKARLEVVENQQKELLQSIEKGSAPQKKTSDKKPQGSNAADFQSLKTAFDRKHFRKVAEDAPNVLKKAHGKEREQALMMYGESLMKLQRPKEAALQFNELVELKPGERQLAVAKLRLGDAFKAMGDKETSKLFYEEVATKYAGTAEAEKAKKALKSKK